VNGQAIYRRWRPQRFSEVVGQEHVTRTLRNAVRLGRVAHGYLFCGPRGIAKTSTARILAKAINCLNPQDGEPCGECELCRAITAGTAYDVIEMDAASNGLVDNVRDLRQHVMTHPDQARRKVYILDEAHRMSAPAFDALLKTLEEPPEHVVFILVTSEADRIPATIASRCQRFDFRRLPQRGIVGRLVEICRAEGVEAEPAALDLIARAATGSMRDAQSILDQLFALGGKTITVGDVETVLGTAGTAAARDLCRHVIRREAGEGLSLISRAVAEGADPRQFCRDVTDYLRGLLLLRLGGPDEAVDVSAETRAEMSELAAAATVDQLLRAVRLFGQADAGWRGTLHYQLPLELAFIDSTLEPSAPVAAARPGAPVAAPAPTAAGPPTAPPGATRPPLARPFSGAPPVRARPAPPASDPSAATARPAASGDTADGAAGSLAAASEDEARAEATPETLSPAEVQRRWGAVRDSIAEKNPRVAAFLGAHTRAVALEGDRLVVQARSQPYREEVGRNLRLILGEWSRQFGQDISVQCVVAESWEQADDTPDPRDEPGIRRAIERGWRARIVE
jgi:DNA polymerase-3 subunit gamma/tau